MKRISLRIANTKRESGLSLVLVLFGILGLSFLVVIFFSLASNDRSSTVAYTNSVKVEELGVGGLEMVIRELRKEITDSARSTANSPGGEGTPVYVPTEAKNLLPERTIGNSEGNLLKTSASNKPLFTGESATLVAANSSSVTPSRNGRFVSAERWNRPALDQFDGVTKPVPDWIYLTRQGPTIPNLTTGSDPESPGYVLGRVAFAIYDLSGTMDINVAGYPDTVSELEAGKKGFPALARLQALGLSTQEVEGLLSFRNAGTRGAYLDYIKDTERHKGFTRTVPGDNRFLSRQELIRFARRRGFEDKLGIMGVFSREKNAPSFSPAQPSVENPNLATARHEGTGKLLFEKRFPLSKLAMLANPESHAGEVQEFFGLKYNGSTRTYDYVGPSSSTQSRIKTLDEIGGEATYRRPNFFETLKAAIMQGSVGQSAGGTASISGQDSEDAQIIQIGASIIDQYDTDYIPTAINFDAGSEVPVWGIENLPYFNKLQYIGQNTNQGILTNGEGGTRNNYNQNPPSIDYAFRWAVELWNPHVQKLPMTSVPTPNIKVALGPVGALARVDIYPNSTATETPDKKVGQLKPIVEAECTNEFNIATGHASFSAAGTVATFYRSFVDPRQVFFGEINQTRIPRDRDYTSAVLNILTPIYVDLFVRGPDGFLHHYFRSWRIGGTPLKMTGNSDRVSSYMVSDPRTNRMGHFDADWRPNSGGSPAYPSTVSVANRYAWPIRISPSILPSESVRSTGEAPVGQGYNTSLVYPGLLFENTSNATQYSDPDGVSRIGDGGFIPGGGGQVPTAQLNPNPAANPPSTASNLTRPKRLDRPFRSVAELGFVFRDAAWKSLNFSSADSADAALLDVFSMEDVDIRAGLSGLNNQRPEIWSAYLNGSLRQDDDAASKMTDAQSDDLADAIVTYLKSNSSQPLLNVSEIVTRLSNTDIMKAASFGGSTGLAIKAQRESAIRALSGNVQSRTWNLMIDLVAQTGRYPKGSTTLNQFVVEGERRYWLHLAIDRYTGEIIDELLEVVQE